MEIATELSLSWPQALVSILSGVGIYIGIIAITRLLGQRILGTISSFDFPVTIAIGTIIGQTTMARPSLLGGLLALVVLFAAQTLASVARHHTRFARKLIENAPILLMADGQILSGNLRRARMDVDALYAELRLYGIGRVSDVKAVVLERNGSVSIIGRERFDPEILRGVAGANRVVATRSPGT